VWQEACVFVLGESGSIGSVNMLTDIFIDGEDKISCYVAVYLSDQKISEFSQDDQTRISKRLDDLLSEGRYKKYGDHYLVSMEKIKSQL
jgi:hypothetical protein